MKNTPFLKALRCENQAPPPVWLMRQAGRFLPSYRALKENYSLWQLFHEPELAARVVHLPLDTLNLDAAIVFSDILVIVEALGLEVDFPEGLGPQVSPKIENGFDIDALRVADVTEELSYVEEQIKMLKNDLDLPLIGFCGAPFTVAGYILERRDRRFLRDTKNWLYNDPHSFHRLLEKLTQASIDYLRMQIKAGVDVVQIFESNADQLAYPQFCEFSLRYLKQIIDGISDLNVPVIVFCKGGALFPQDLAKLKPNAISFDWRKELVHLRQVLPRNIAVQGNLDPDLLKAPRATIRAMTERLLSSMHGDPGFIVNLGHGILPDTPVENAQFFIDTIKQFSMEPALA